MSDKYTKTAYRNSVTGSFTSKSFAESHPDITQKEERLCLDKVLDEFRERFVDDFDNGKDSAGPYIFRDNGDETLSIAKTKDIEQFLIEIITA